MLPPTVAGGGQSQLSIFGGIGTDTFQFRDLNGAIGHTDNVSYDCVRGVCTLEFQSSLISRVPFNPFAPLQLSLQVVADAFGGAGGCCTSSGGPTGSPTSSQVTYFDPWQFTVLDQNGNIIPDLYFNSAEGANYLVTDGSSPTPTVPEPSTWAMLLIGFAVLTFMAHRRKSEPALMAA